MSITLEQYRAAIGGFTPPGLLKLLKRRKAAAWRELLGEEVVDRAGALEGDTMVCGVCDEAEVREVMEVEDGKYDVAAKEQTAKVIEEVLVREVERLERVTKGWRDRARAAEKKFGHGTERRSVGVQAEASVADAETQEGGLRKEKRTQTSDGRYSSFWTSCPWSITRNTSASTKSSRCPAVRRPSRSTNPSTTTTPTLYW